MFIKLRKRRNKKFYVPIVNPKLRYLVIFLYQLGVINHEEITDEWIKTVNQHLRNKDTDWARGAGPQI